MVLVASCFASIRSELSGCCTNFPVWMELRPMQVWREIWLATFTEQLMPAALITVGPFSSYPRAALRSCCIVSLEAPTEILRGPTNSGLFREPVQHDIRRRRLRLRNGLQGGQFRDLHGHAQLYRCRWRRPRSRPHPRPRRQPLRKNLEGTSTAEWFSKSISLAMRQCFTASRAEAMASFRCHPTVDFGWRDFWLNFRWLSR